MRPHWPLPRDFARTPANSYPDNCQTSRRLIEGRGGGFKSPARTGREAGPSSGRVQRRHRSVAAAPRRCLGARKAACASVTTRRAAGGDQRRRGGGLAMALARFSTGGDPPHHLPRTGFCIQVGSGVLVQAQRPGRFDDEQPPQRPHFEFRQSAARPARPVADAATHDVPRRCGRSPGPPSPWSERSLATSRSRGATTGSKPRSPPGSRLVEATATPAPPCRRRPRTGE